MVIAKGKVRAGLSAAAIAFVLAFAGEAAAQLPPPPPPPPPPGGNNPPMIIALDAQQLPGKKFRIFGRVADETPQACSVSISGAANGSAPCDAAGNFSKVFDVAALGNIVAVASDGTQQSQGAQHTLSNAAPSVNNFIAVGGPNNTWTFSGSVGDEAPGGLTVTLTGPPGVQGATAIVQADGTWSVTLTLTPGAGGNVTATVTDWYGATGSGYTSF
jgi:hypothetical protein